MINTSGNRFTFYILTGAAWMLLWVIYNFLNYPRSFGAHTLNDVWHSVYIIIVNFLFFEYGLSFTRKKRPAFWYNTGAGILIILLYIILLSFGLYAWTYLGKILHIYTSFRQSVLFPGGSFNTMIDETGYLAQTGIASAFFFGIIYLLYNNYRLQLVTREQQTVMREAELNYLKSQTNPHFLFNTLNNIYALAIEKSELAASSVLQLSKILRFMLYETGSKFIPVEKEIMIIRDYIELEKLRYDDSFQLNFEVDIVDMQARVRPLLLVPLVENAFKHGTSEHIGRAFVDIKISLSGKELVIVVKNASVKQETGIKENIGLTNLKRQLELQYTDYSLTIEQQESMFIAELSINLSSEI